MSINLWKDIAVTLGTAAFLWPATGQAADVNGDLREAVLLPLAFQSSVSIPGAFGTMWSGEAWIENRGSIPVELFDCPVPFCGGQYVAPGAIERLDSGVGIDPAQGHLLQLSAGQAADLTFSNRIYERTLRAQPRGVEIPIVREGTFFSAEQAFLGVPSGQGVRVSLRIYDPWIWVAETPHLSPSPHLDGVEVEVLNPDEVHIDATVLRPVRPARLGTFDAVWNKPGFAAIYDLASLFPRMNDHPYVHIRVRPIPAGAQYWGMVAVTDNETQTLSIITAQ